MDRACAAFSCQSTDINDISDMIGSRLPRLAMPISSTRQIHFYFTSHLSRKQKKRPPKKKRFLPRGKAVVRLVCAVALCLFTPSGARVCTASLFTPGGIWPFHAWRVHATKCSQLPCKLCCIGTPTMVDLTAEARSGA